MSRLRTAVLAMLVAPVPTNATGQSLPEDSAVFLQAARAAADRYSDQQDAIAAGYRKVGPDFPGMGEHWVQPGLLVSARFDPANPPILSYTSVKGRPTLVGVAYALPLAPDEAPPDVPWPGAWHDHSESVDEESLLVAPLQGNGENSPRLAMLHAWVRSDNPDGIFAQHNWSLPFLRLGLVPAEPPAAAAARSLSLAAGGLHYHVELVLAAAAPANGLEGPVRAALSDTGERVEQLLGERASGPVTAAELQQLTQLFAELAAALEDVLGPTAWARVAPYFAGAGHH